MAFRTGEVAIESSMLLVMDVSKLFSKDEWSLLQIAAKGPSDIPRVAVEFLEKKLGKEVKGFAQVYDVHGAGQFPIFMDRESLTVYIRGVGIREYSGESK